MSATQSSVTKVFLKIANQACCPAFTGPPDLTDLPLWVQAWSPPTLAPNLASVSLS